MIRPEPMMAEGVSSYGAVAADAFACTSRATPINRAQGVAESGAADSNDYGDISIRQTTTPALALFVHADLHAFTDDQDSICARESLGNSLRSAAPRISCYR